jgi:hypothetical protein
VKLSWDHLCKSRWQCAISNHWPAPRSARLLLECHAATFQAFYAFQ